MTFLLLKIHKTLLLCEKYAKLREEIQKKFLFCFFAANLMSLIFTVVLGVCCEKSEKL